MGIIMRSFLTSLARSSLLLIVVSRQQSEGSRKEGSRSPERLVLLRSKRRSCLALDCRLLHSNEERMSEATTTGACHRATTWNENNKLSYCSPHKRWLDATDRRMVHHQGLIITGETNTTTTRRTTGTLAGKRYIIYIFRKGTGRHSYTCIGNSKVPSDLLVMICDDDGGDG